MRGGHARRVADGGGHGQVGGVNQAVRHVRVGGITHDNSIILRRIGSFTAVLRGSQYLKRIFLFQTLQISNIFVTMTSSGCSAKLTGVCS